MSGSRFTEYLKAYAFGAIIKTTMTDKTKEVLMNIVVCVKQVPDTTKVKLNPETKTLVRDGVENIMNPFDALALETALLLKDRNQATVTVVSMGLPQAKDILKESIALGADKAVLLSDRVLGGSDTLATSTALAALVKSMGEVDLVLCGKEAVDGVTAQVGPEMAEHLGLPQVTNAMKVYVENGKIVVERETENYAQKIICDGPTLVTMVAAESDLRFASLRGKMKARKAEIPVLSAADLGIDPAKVGLGGSPTRVKGVKPNIPPEVKNEVIDGVKDPDAAVETLFAKLLEAGLIRK